MSKSKVMLQLFFWLIWNVHMEFILEGVTVNKHHYKEIIRPLRSSIHHKRSELWRRKNCLLLHDKAPAHRSMLVQEEMAKQQNTVLPHPPYSPDLAPCDFFFFPRLKVNYMGIDFIQPRRSWLPQGKLYRTSLHISFSSVSSSDNQRWQSWIVANSDYFEGGCGYV
jgi:transposase